MNTDVMYAAPAAPQSEDVDRPDVDLTAEGLTAEDLTAEDLIEEVSIDGMCGVY
jgi:mycofactocin precursor